MMAWSVSSHETPLGTKNMPVTAAKQCEATARSGVGFQTSFPPRQRRVGVGVSLRNWPLSHPQASEAQGMEKVP
jgi:hypothetical protein